MGSNANASANAYTYANIHIQKHTQAHTCTYLCRGIPTTVVGKALVAAAMTMPLRSLKRNCNEGVRPAMEGGFTEERAAVQAPWC
jgi:ABC-type uncharacterized transport system YnjBCD substrate-binding protein